MLDGHWQADLQCVMQNSQVSKIDHNLRDMILPIIVSTFLALIRLRLLCAILYHAKYCSFAASHQASHLLMSHAIFTDDMCLSTALYTPPAWEV